MSTRVAITVGSFDGVHVGHAALLAEARRRADEGGRRGRVVAVSFFPHPLSTLNPTAAPLRLTSWQRRRSLLIEAGADEVVRLDPSPSLLAKSPEKFVDMMVGEHAPEVWIEGPDFRFGKARRGDVSLLHELGGARGFETVVMEQQEVVLNDLTIAPASSSLARWLLGNGRMADLKRVLGRAHELSGVVRRGDQRGREIGCRTANIECDSAPPGDGVYAGAATLPDGRRFSAAISVGGKPTFGDRPRAVEAHLIGWDGALAPPGDGYGWTLTVAFHAWLREQIRYDTVAALSEQIRRDIERTREIVERNEATAEAPA